MNRTVILILLFSVLTPLGGYSDSQPESYSDVYIIPINGDIDRSLTIFLRRSIDAAEQTGAGSIIFEINTFGGRVDSALQIATLIGGSDAETIAYIPALPESTGVSWSAGALISFSCDRIYMAPGTSMGAAAPVYQSSEGMQTAEEKTVSAVRAQMAALAEKNGYPKTAALAMVDSDIELIEAEINGRTVLVSADEIEFIKEDTEAQNGTFKKGKTISAKGKLLTLTANEMLKYGISSGAPADREELFTMLELDNPETAEAESTTPDRLIAMVTGSALTTILIMLGLGALYMEITSPGFGIPGTLAIIIFAIIFIANGMLGYVGSLEILLFIAGIVLLIVEIFLIPGFGAAGISGILLIAASLLLSQQGFILPEFEWQIELLKRNVLTTGAGIFGSIIITAVLIQLFPRIGVFNRLILQTSQLQEDGYSLQPGNNLEAKIGKTGTSLTTLRPSGKAEFDGFTEVVETDGEYIEEGADVVIIAADSNRLLVKRLTEVE
ncbi:MAG: NfeD family protein [Spirochaetales bacterium]|uniref:NfeD family protein n=1 Tax=Candidatus Thalassospirochaeta sargassi TaxID=3119039 RepID=A0AAJ1IAK6_9SPIO|nr:NfeD family protein [Spirochaetales bacterium]